MPRPCARHHGPRPDRCRLCFLAAHDPRYQRLWGIDAPAATPRHQRPPRDPSKPRLSLAEMIARKRH